MLSAERGSYLAHSLERLLRLPLPPEALLPLSDLAHVLYLEASQSADAAGDELGTVPDLPRVGRVGC
jgi:hypothetical protein